jgi:hypothetical protein
MSDKDKKFRPDAGFIVAVHANVLGIRAVANELDMFAEDLAKAMSEAGFQFIPDPFNLSSDAGKVIELQERQKTAGLQIVKEFTDDDASSDTSTN